MFELRWIWQAREKWSWEFDCICIQLKQQRDRGLYKRFPTYDRDGCSGKITSSSIDGRHDTNCARTFSHTGNHTAEGYLLIVLCLIETSLVRNTPKNEKENFKKKAYIEQYLPSYDAWEAECFEDHIWTHF